MQCNTVYQQYQDYVLGVSVERLYTDPVNDFIINSLTSLNTSGTPLVHGIYV